MNRLSSRLSVRIALLTVLVGAASVSMRGQWAPKPGEWPTYGGDLASTRYSPLDQINATNFSKLQLAFRFKTENLGPRPEFQFQSTPLMVNGRLFTTAGTRRAAVALSATTGEMLWMHSIDEGKRGEAAPRQLSGRGLSYWSDGKEERIIYVTAGYQMIALDAKTGQRVKNFGTDGIVDLKTGLDQEGLDLTTAEIGLHAAPIISKDIIVIGAAHREGGAPRSKTNVKGYIRGFDVRTGKRVWVFHTIPMKGEFGFDTWDPDAAAYTGNTGVWAQMSADEELGIVYMPVELPTGDYYGGHRGRQQEGLARHVVVLRDAARARHQDRPAQVALPAGAPRHLGSRHSVRADPDGPGRGRQAGEGGGAADQAELALRVRSRHRQAGVADRRAARREGRSARRMVFADAAVRDQAARVRAAGRHGR